MRRDFILPVVLLVAVMAMAVYGWTASDEQHRGTRLELAATPIPCEDARLIGRIAQLPEASGLASSRRHPQLFWSHNDSAEPLLVALDAGGDLRGRVQLTGASVIDWEAITVAPCTNGDCLYVADIGDNGRKRPAIAVYRASEPSPSESATEPAVRIDATYPEGPQDAEALFALNGSLFIVTKGEGSPVRVYRFPAVEPGPRVTLQLVATLTDTRPRKTTRITDAAVSPDGKWIALRSNDFVLFYDAAKLVRGQPGTPLSVSLDQLKEPQGEGVAWADSRTLFLAGEAGGGGTFARLSCTLPG